MQWQDVLDPTYNEVTSGSITPANGPSVAAAATGSNKRSLTVSGSNSTAAPASAGASGGSAPAGSLVTGLIVFSALVAIIMFVTHKWGGESSDFSNVRASVYNVLIISLIAFVGLPVLKLGAIQLAGMGVPFADDIQTWAMAV